MKKKGNAPFKNFNNYLKSEKIYSYSVEELLEITKLTKYQFYRDYQTKDQFLTEFFQYYFYQTLKEFIFLNPRLYRIKEMHAKTLKILQENDFLLITNNLKPVIEYFKYSYIKTIVNKTNKNVMIKTPFDVYPYQKVVEKSANMLALSIFDQEAYLFDPQRF